MGKSKAALPDLTKVIELKMDFTAVSAPELVKGNGKRSSVSCRESWHHRRCESIPELSCGEENEIRLPTLAPHSGTQL